MMMMMMVMTLSHVVSCPKLQSQLFKYIFLFQNVTTLIHLQMYLFFTKSHVFNCPKLQSREGGGGLQNVTTQVHLFTFLIFF